MDIGSGNTYPSGSLSNFSPHPFIIDGVECASMEGFLQSLKFDKEHIQVEICKLVGRAAKWRGKDRNSAWKSQQTLWWKGVAYGRDSAHYEALITRAYDALFENEGFRRALEAAGNAVLTHSIGAKKMKDTVLTEREFIRQLNRLRKKLVK